MEAISWELEQKCAKCDASIDLRHTLGLDCKLLFEIDKSS